MKQWLDDVAALRRRHTMGLPWSNSDTAALLNAISELECTLDTLVPSWRDWSDLAYEQSCLEFQRIEIAELKAKLARYEQNKQFGEAAHEALQKVVDGASNSDEDKSPF